MDESLPEKKEKGVGIWGGYADVKHLVRATLARTPVYPTDSQEQIALGHSLQIMDAYRQGIREGSTNTRARALNRIRVLLRELGGRDDFCLVCNNKIVVVKRHDGETVFFDDDGRAHAKGCVNV